MKISRGVIPITLFGVGLVVGSTLGASSPAAKPNVKNLMQMPLADDFTPGREVGHVPFKKWHVAVAGTKGAKILVFRVHTMGEPWRYADK